MEGGGSNASITPWAAGESSGSPHGSPPASPSRGGERRGGVAKPHSSILAASASGAKELSAAERREMRQRERKARGEPTFEFKKKNQLPPLEPELPAPELTAEAGVGSAVVLSMKGGVGSISASGRRSSIEEGGIGARSRMFSWGPTAVAEFLEKVGFPQLAPRALSKGIMGSSLLHVRQPIGADDAIGLLLGTGDNKEQRDLVGKIKDARTEELACAPKVLMNVQSKLDQAKGKGGTQLNLDSSKMTRFPDVACELVTLTNLSCCGNNLKNLMPEIGLLTKLLSLKLTNNKILSLPDSIGYLHSLQLFLLDNNQLRSLPNGIVTCTGLKVLDLSQNKLSMLPTGMYACTRINKLNLYDNPLQVPSEVIDSGPDLVLKFLKAMNVCERTAGCNLSSMKLVAIPPVIYTLTNMTDLNLASNAISRLDGLQVQTRLRSLTVSKNPIKSLPLSLKALTSLTELASADCDDMESPPRVILELPGRSIIGYLRAKSHLIGDNIDSMFAAFDLDGSGSISKEELSSGLHLVDLGHRRAEVDMILETTDADNNGLISLQEFRELMLGLLKLGAVDKQSLDLSGLGIPVFVVDFSQPAYIHSLNLSNNRLSSLPDTLRLMVDLEELNLDQNELTEVPVHVQINSLKTLSLRGNSIQSVPKWLAERHHLRVISLDNNQLSSLPCEVGGMTSLDHLGLDGNPLKMPLKRLLFEGSSFVTAYLALFMHAQEDGFLDLCNMGLQAMPLEAELSTVKTCLISGNKLIVSPASLQSATQLIHLDMSSNGMENVEGHIYACITTVQTINLAHNRLQGFSRRIALLQNLVSLDLSNNRIVEMPNTLSGLTFLKVLDVSNNGLEHMPPAICNLCNLQELRAEQNHLWGLTDELGQMTGLKRLNCRSNNIQKLPDCFSLMNLTSFDVSRNQLSAIPYSMGSLLSCCTELKLDRHLHLDDPQDVIIARGTKALLTYLSRQLAVTTTKVLDMSRQQLAALTVPLDRMERMCLGLMVLDVSDNQIHELPRTIGADLECLEKLVLRNNRMNTLPVSTKHMKTLTHLDIAGNLFDRVPEMLTYTRLIRYLNMDRNNLDSLYRKIDTVAGGGFDDALAASKRVQAKAVSHGVKGLKGLIQNKVMDKVHTKLKSENRSKQVGALFQLFDIETLFVSENTIHILPGSISRFEQLTKLDMHSNQLQDLPPDIGHCTCLTHIDVSHNDLMGLPAEIGTLQKVSFFNLSHNKVGRLPDEIGNMTSLTELNFDSNNLEFIPVEIEGLETSLTLLHAAGNIIRDPPAEILAQGRDALFTYLRRVRNGRKSRELVLIEMKLENVNFNYESLTVLTSIELSGNLIAELPKEILILTNLTVLKAPGNRLTRIVENGQVGVLSNLTKLYLRDNRLPNLDTSIGELKLLKEIDLQSNRLTDLVPNVVDCQKVKTINLSRNLMETMPKHIFRIPDITFLKADHNLLRELPGAMCFAVHIKELDLSFNRLELLPADIGNLYEMVYLNLDHNLLKEVPKSIKYCSSLQLLYLNDNKLSSLTPAIRSVKTLEELHMRNNCLIVLPPEIKSLGSLKALSVEGNPFLSLPSSTRELKSLKFLGVGDNQSTRQALGDDESTLPDPTVVFATSDIAVTMRKPPRHVALGGVNKMGAYVDRITRADNALTIDLTHMDLIFVPVEVLHLTALTALDVKENRITEIPAALVTLTNLTHLNMSGNEISEIPANFGGLTNLVVLSMARNHIPLLPGSMENMVKLKICDMHVNELKTLLPVQRHHHHDDEQILASAQDDASRAMRGSDASGDSSDSDQEAAEYISHRMEMKMMALGIEMQLGVIGIVGIQDLECSYNSLAKLPDLSAMRSIRRINVSHNVLRSLPEEICELHTLEKIESGDNRVRSVPPQVSKLTRLTLLSLKNNNLRSLPPEIGSCLKLKYMSLYANDLVLLPEEISLLTNLVRLSTQANKISKLPWRLGDLVSLKILDLSSNPLVALPPSLGALDHKLETLTLNDCEDLMDPPIMIIRQGHEVLMNYLRKVWRGFNTRRMVCVGLKMGRLRMDLSHPDLRELVELRLDKNLLQVLPPQVGELYFLISLRLRENLFEKLPSTLTNLTSLQELDISKNRLMLLPRTILNLTRLIRLRCGNNPIPYAIPQNWIEDKVQKFLINHVRETIGKRVSNMWGKLDLSESFKAWKLLTTKGDDVGDDCDD